MAVNMNERECVQMIFGALIVLCGVLQVAIATTTTESPTTVTQLPSTSAVNETSTAAPTTVPTSPTTTTTTIAPQQPPTAFDANSLIGVCPCDLTGNACEVNCCCDPDCTPDDKRTFSQCLPFATNVDNRLCMRDEIIAFENSNPVISELMDENIFCIYYDNKEERNYFSIPSSVKTLAGIEAYRREFPAFSFQSTPSNRINFDSPFYKSGDPVYTVYESGTVGVLGLPQKLTTTECVDDNPAAYLLDRSHSCVRTINSGSACQAGAQGLDVNNFIQGFRVVTSPRLFQELNTSVPGTNNFYSLYNNSLTVAVELDGTGNVRPVQCYDAGSGLTGPCSYSTTPLPTPTLTANTCEKVVRQVHYRVITEGTTGIVRVLARVVLTNVVISANSPVDFIQSFSSAFEASSTTSVFERSGNPGYVVGQPVLAGVLNETSRTDPITYQIFLSSSRDRYMTVVRASASGDCFTDSASRIPVLFGQNVRTGCLLRVSASNLTEYCALMQQKIIETMEFDSVPELTANGFRETNRYVALYGNSDVGKTGDWVKVLYQNRLRPTNPTSSTVSCQLSLGMHIQILYANIGALVNPQAKIIAVSYLYDTQKAMQIRPTLTGEYNQPVEISTSVAFIDVSKPAERAQGEAPIFLAKLPYDFFYPFISGASAPTPPLLFAFCPVLVLLWWTL